MFNDQEIYMDNGNARKMTMTDLFQWIVAKRWLIFLEIDIGKMPER